MKGFALGLALKQRQNATRKSPNCKTRTQDNSVGARSCRRSRDTRPPPALGNSYYTKVSIWKNLEGCPSVFAWSCSLQTWPVRIFLRDICLTVGMVSLHLQSYKRLLVCKTLEGCCSVSNGYAAFKLDQFTFFAETFVWLGVMVSLHLQSYKRLLVCKTLEGCYSSTTVHASFRLDQRHLSDWGMVSQHLHRVIPKSLSL